MQQYLNPAERKYNASKIDPSKLYLYSLGYAAANIEVGQTDLMVIPIEKFSMIDGELTDGEVELSASSVNLGGGQSNNAIKASIAIKAKWFSMNPWLKLPGLVRRGELVRIYRLGDTNEYYWENLGMDNVDLRKKDIVVLNIPNETSNEVQKSNAKNSVYFEVNTLDKHITLSTPTNDGEPCGYIVQINMKAGVFTISDDVGNYIAIDSPKEKIILRNKSESRIELNREDIRISSRKSVKITTKEFTVDATDKMHFQTKQWSSRANRYSADIQNVVYNVNEFKFVGKHVQVSTDSIRHHGRNIGQNHIHQSGRGTTGGVAN